MYSQLCSLDLDDEVSVDGLGKVLAGGLTVRLIDPAGCGFALHEDMDRNLYAQEILVHKNGTLTGQRVYLQGSYIKSFRWVCMLIKIYDMALEQLIAEARKTRIKYGMKP